MQLSVLDQSPVPEGSSPADALRNSVDLARLADDLSYHRYWLAEHHGTPMLASTSPEVLIAAVAAATARIRVGSGGVMLPHYSPLKVAELIAYIDGKLPADHPFARLTALPGLPERPDLWLLGSSPQSAIWAAQLGLPYAFADFINPAGAEIAGLYRDRFEPSARLERPHVCVASSVVCADTDEEASRLAASGRMTYRMLRQGRPIPIPPPDKALRYLAEARASAKPSGRRGIVGSPQVVKEGLDSVATEYGADELMVVTITYDHEARRRSYELVAEAFALAPTADAAA